MSRSLFLSVFLLCALATALAVAEDLDSVFTAPPPDIAANGGTQNSPLSQLTQTGILFSGSYNAFVGLVAGWTVLPPANDWEMGYSASLAFGLTSSLSVDARPDPAFRVHGTLTASVPDPLTTPLTITNAAPPKLGELFCDFNPSDALFFRIGKQVVTWGISRVFPLDNLPARIPFEYQITEERFDPSAAIGLKLSIPVGAHSLTALALAKNGYFRDISSPSPLEVGYGLMGDMVINATEISFGGYYEQYLRPRALVAVKTAIWDIDAQAEIIASYLAGEGLRLSGLGNLFWQNADSQFSVLGEFMYNAESRQAQAYPTGAAVALTAGFKKVFGAPVDAGLQWKHAFVDNSGSVTPGIVWTPMNHMRIAFGVPLYYGAPQSEMMKQNPDPLTRALSLALRLEILGDY